MREHLREASKGNSLPLYCAMRIHKYTVEILFKDIETYAELLELEIKTIKEYKDNNIKLYNVTTGGEGCTGVKFSKETRIKMSEAHKGKVLSIETKKKIREGNKGKIFSQKTRQKLKDACKHRVFSEETKRKMGESHKGAKSGNSKPKEFYATRPTTRSSFKNICKNQSWNFDDFIEEFATWYIYLDNTKKRQYYYKSK